MGYVRKNSTVANPAKKSLTVFQNSGTRTVPVYDTVGGTVTYSISSYTHEMQVTNSSPYTLQCSCDGVSFTVNPRSHGTSGAVYGGGVRNGTVSCNGQVLYSGSGTGSFSKYIQVGSRTETYWNTKWSKRSA